MEQSVGSVSAIYEPGNEQRPCKLSAEIKKLKGDIAIFPDSCCKLIAEVPSVTKLDQKGCEEKNDDILTSDHAMKEARSAKRWIDSAYQLTRREATEILVFMVNDLERSYHAEMNNSFPVAYEMKGSSMTSTEFRKMMDHVIAECEKQNLNVLVTAADGQWHNYGVRDNENKPLTLIQLQKDVWAAETRSKQKSTILRELKMINSVNSARLEECVLLEKGQDNVIYVSGHLVYGHVPALRQTMFNQFIHQNETPSHEKSDDLSLSGPNDIRQQSHFDELITVTSSDVLDTETVLAMQTTFEDYPLPTTQYHVHSNSLPQALGDALNTLYSEAFDVEMNVDEVYASPVNSYRLEGIQDDGIVLSQDEQTSRTNDELPEDHPNEHVLGFGAADLFKMKLTLADAKENKRTQWTNMTDVELRKKFSTAAEIYRSFTRKELAICLTTIIDRLKGNGTKCSLSWPKPKLVDLFSRVFGDCSEIEIKTRKQRTPASLQAHCLKVVSSKYSKELLNAIMAEYSWAIELSKWKSSSVTDRLVFDDNIGFDIDWFSKPKVDNRKTRLHFTDACHILTCLRSKVCTTGISGLRKSAWRNAAMSAETHLNISMVDECVDKQSVQFAKTVFAQDVQEFMMANGYQNKAIFCTRIHDWFAAEDEPGIPARERCVKRLKLRKWLLDGIRFDLFPPHASYIKGIPIVTYEGLLVNIERKLMMFPYCNGHAYNVRATGSQEIEQFFGTFRDMDPSGSGTPKPDDIPMMMWRAVEICYCRFDSSRAFYMRTSKATVYPEVMFCDSEQDQLHQLPILMVDASNNCITINPRDHFFDTKERKRVKQKKKKKTSISSPHRPSRGEMGVRQFHKTDESKVLPHLRRGLPDIPD